VSMIALTKEDKQRYLKLVLDHLWQGYLYTVLDYLRNTIEAKDEEDPNGTDRLS
jgi:hypothetical protein